MSGDAGFGDLRLNHQSGQGQDSFWPSFTDIMTVIVMIFMLAMVVLLLRNIELVKQLRSTMEAERQAVELARATGEEKEGLALKLVAMENELAMLRMEQMRLQELGSQQQAELRARQERLASQQQAIARLEQESSEQQQLARQLEQQLRESETLADTRLQSLRTLEQNLQTTRGQLESTQQELAGVRTDLAGVEGRYQLSQQALAQWQERYQQQSQELQQARAAEMQGNEALAELQGRFSELKVKYDKLIRPARSPEGRYLVEIRYSKRNGRFLIETKGDGQGDYRPISRQSLEQRLAALKEQQTDGLYIKVIFPENSGLSFSEAWSFTSELQGRYDYYSQDGGPQPVPVQVPGQ